MQRELLQLEDLAFKGREAGDGWPAALAGVG